MDGGMLDLLMGVDEMCLNVLFLKWEGEVMLICCDIICCDISCCILVCVDGCSCC